MIGSNLEGVNKQKTEDAKGVADHEWSEATWKASKEEWHIANGTLRHDLKMFGHILPLTAAHTTFEQVSVIYVALYRYAIFSHR